MAQENFDELYNQILDGDGWDYSTLDKLISIAEKNVEQSLIERAKKAYCHNCVWKGLACAVDGEKCKGFGRFSFNLHNPSK